MAIETTYTLARANLAKLLDEVTENRETVVIHRRGSEDVALIAASELEYLAETAHLLRSPRNAERLFAAVVEAKVGGGRTLTVEQLREELGLERDE
jgi:antitoxin YefM